jgi:hypothetical protein
VTIKGEMPFLIDTCQGFVDQLKAHSISRAELVQVAPAGIETTQPEEDIPEAFAKTTKPKTRKPLKRTAASTAVAVRPVNVSAQGKPQDHPCPFCPDQLTYSGYYSHVKLRHGFATPQVGHGPNCPVCNTPHRQLNNHARKDHAPLTNAGQLFAEAVKQGDPHGIVAKRRKAAKNVKLS